MRRRYCDSLIIPEARSLTRLEANGGGARSYSCDTRLTGLDVMLNLFQHLIRVAFSIQTQKRFIPDSRLTVHNSREGARPLTPTLSLRRGGNKNPDSRFTVHNSRLVAQSLNHLVTTYSVSTSPDIAVFAELKRNISLSLEERGGVRCAACLFTPEVLPC